MSSEKYYLSAKYAYFNLEKGTEHGKMYLNRFSYKASDPCILLGTYEKSLRSGYYMIYMDEMDADGVEFGKSIIKAAQRFISKIYE